ncbi:AraC family transcriptional regulator [Marinivivus vitaminiproducens]|uniref:AraC family transcriptional regulator n=1 Tax=Marinivivus vitaminiproducens TaxID=3035935 RepID=UPI00279D73DB|nr:AraC family transcriptional regulator [Geminicoccaceae bacterium SCSIO 64248]
MRVRADLAGRIGRHASGDGILETPLPRVSLTRSSVPTEPLHTLYPPSVCLVAQGRKEVTVGGRRFMYDPSTVLVVGIDLPVIGAVTLADPDTPFLCMRLELDRSLLADVLAVRPGAGTGMPASAVATCAATPELIDASVRLVELIDTPDEAAYLAPLVEQEILHRLVMGPQGPLLRQIASGEGRIGRIDRAVRFIRASYREAFAINDLAAIAGMSVSAFHDHFRAVMAMTPLQFRNHIRLQEARRLMMVDDMTAAEAGFAVGYDSPSQFSREYVRIHRVPPRQDVARLRELAIEGL